MSSGTPLPAPISRPCLAGLMLVGSLLLLTALPSPLEEPGDEAVVQVFAPNETQSDSARDLVRRLERVHYLGLPADDTLSEHVFDNYIDFLDTARSVLLASDYEEFLPWRTTLDDALLKGDLDPAFAMFNRYHSRQIERLAWAVELLKGDLDELPFGGNEELELDRETAPWAQSQEELDTFWRKRLASQIISLQLAGSTLEEAQQKLLERQQEQLRRASQYHERDVFQFFMTALTDAYDPHTRYMVPRLADNFDMAMSLSFEGIGALLRPDGEFALIERIIPGGPAEHDGRLQAGDRILGVAQLQRQAINLDLPPISSIKAVQDAHQRGFSSAVLANDAVYGASRNVKADAMVGNHGTEAFMDVAKAYSRPHDLPLARLRGRC